MYDAAKLCADFIVTHGVNEYGDWFLPSKAELNLMYQYLKTYIVWGGFEKVYLSSSECGNGNVWHQNMESGFQSPESSSNAYRVRPIRAIL